MGYRDERDADRARIDALERELTEARERATRAEAEARALAAEKKAAPAEAAAPKLSKRAERKRAKKQRERPASVPRRQRETVDVFPEAQRRRYFGASAALSLVAYGSAVAVAFSATGEQAIFDRAIFGGMIAVVAIFVGHVIIGYATRAPGVFNGTMITLIASSATLGGAFAAVVSIEDLFSAEHLAAARIVAVSLALTAGGFVTAHWSSDAASSSAISGGD